MDNIFEMRFSYEQKIKDEVISKFSNKQGGGYNVFSYYWQCFVWAAIIGFLRNEKRQLTPPIADRPFSLNTMFNNNGEKDAQALICLAIAKAGSLDIMKNPIDAINLINEYANGGFYHILKLMENGENSFNDLEKVKQEIFSRNYLQEDLSKDEDNIILETCNRDNLLEEIKGNAPFINDVSNSVVNADDSHALSRPNRRWRTSERAELEQYFKNGMSIKQLADYFNRSEENIKEVLIKLKLFV